MATITINTTPEEDARIVAAFGKWQGLVDQDGNPRNATGAEVKAQVISFIKNIVRSVEGEEAAEAARSGVGTVDPT